MAYQSFDLEWSKPFHGSYEEVPIDDDAHDESDYGGGSHRALTTRTRSKISYVRRSVTRDEKEAIRVFYLVHKTVSFFYWTNHFTSEILLVRFSSPPKFSPVVLDEVWDTSIELEEV